MSTPENTLHQDPSHPEAGKSTLRQIMRERIEHKATTILGSGGALGDTIVAYAVVHKILTRLCEEEGLPKENLRIRFSELEDIGRERFELLRVLQDTTRDMKSSSSHYYYGPLQRYAAALGVKLQPQDLQEVPEPHQYNWRPMNDFDRGQIVKQGEELRKSIVEGSHHDRLIVVAQGGSVAEKRFTNFQVRDITRLLRQLYPKAYIAVITDSDDATATPEQLPYASYANKIIPSDGYINDECAYLYAMDSFVSTDSFAAWLGLGCRAMRSDRNGRIYPSDGTILYTAADPRTYNVPGCTVVESPVLEYARKRGKLGTKYNSILGMGDYAEFTETVYGTSSRSIHSYDMQLLLTKLSQQAQG